MSDDDQDPIDAALVGFIQAVAFVGSAAIVGLMIGLSLGCGIRLDPGPLEVKPITVIHEIGLDEERVREFFEERCQIDYAPYMDEAACVEEKMKEFNAALVKGMG